MRQYDGIIAPTFYVFVVSMPTLKIPYFLQRCTKTPLQKTPSKKYPKITQKTPPKHLKKHPKEHPEIHSKNQRKHLKNT